MPRYYFHLEEGGSRITDDEGLSLPDATAAQAEAVKGARSIMASEVLNGTLPLAATLIVEDDAGAPIAALPFRDAVLIDG